MFIAEPVVGKFAQPPYRQSIGILLTVLLGMLLLGCSISSRQTIEYTGRVLDVETQNPISGAEVTLNVQGVPQIEYTDSEGVYHFNIRIDSRTSGQVRIEIAGYKTYTRTITLDPQIPNLEDIRLAPVQPIPPTATIEPATSPEPPGYDFEIDIQGWQTSEGDLKRAVLSTTTTNSHLGNQSLVLDTELYGSGSIEYANHGQDDVYRHTEALVYFNQIPQGWDRPGPYDLTGKKLSCFVYLPTGLIAADDGPPAYVRLIVKDQDFVNQFSEPIMITDEVTEKWLELIYVVSPDPSSDFDATQVNAMGVRLDSLDNSTVSYSGPIYIDYCTIEF